MASPRPAAAQQLRLADAHPRAGGSEINFSAQRQRQAAQLAASAALAALGDDSPISDDDQSHSERMPLNSRGGGGGVGSSSSNAGLVARGSASPSGFGLSSSLHPFPPPGSSPGGFAQKREKMKGHPVLRLNHLVADHPYLCIVVGLLVLASCCWLALLPAQPDATALDQTTDASPSASDTIGTPALIASTDEPPASPPATSISAPVDATSTPSASDPAAAAGSPSQPVAAAPSQPAAAAPSGEPNTVNTPASTTPAAPAAETANTPAPEPTAVAPTQPLTPTPTPTPTPQKIEEPPKPVEPTAASEPVAQPPAQPEPTAPVAAPTPIPEPAKQPESAPLPPTPTPAPVATDGPPPAVSTPPSTNSAADTSLGEAAAKLNRVDLDESALRCTSSSTAVPCDWSWGQFSRSPNSEDHPSDDLNIDTRWKKPQDFYTFQAGVHVSGEGTGVVVRIAMKDLCCTGPLPLSYFRITAHGAAQAASNPPLALGPMPTALGRGHQAAHLSRTGWGPDIDLSSSVDESRVVQTFLLLPDPGVYSIEVILLHYNSSREMISEVFPHRSRLYEQRGGLWVNRNVNNARGEIGTQLTIPSKETAALRTDRSSLPLCGQEGPGKLGGYSPLGTQYGFPLVGRWIFEPPTEPDPSVGYLAPPATTAAAEEIDYTGLPRRWLAEHSVYAPYFCRLDTSTPDLLARALERAVWTHFTGDSNTRHLMHTTCALANGTLELPVTHIPKMYDPPHSCIGPSSPDNRPDSETGLTVGSAARWVLTYTNWFWGKEQTLTPSFNFGQQCSQYTEQLVWAYHGWPGCTLLPPRFHAMDGPGFTYFAWGSHPMEWGYSTATADFFLSQEAFGLDYFKHHPSMFVLTTATTPQKIADVKALSRRMRNNERLQAMNMQIVDAVMHEREKYASRSSATDSWIPVFDFFSPTLAAHEALSGDSVHFGLFLIGQAPKWLAHYMLHAPNFGPPAAAAPAPQATQPVAP